MLRLMITVSVLLVATATAVRGVPSDPFHYHWRDIGGNCVEDCNNYIYKCPCIHVNIPR